MFDKPTENSSGYLLKYHQIINLESISKAFLSAYLLRSDKYHAYAG